MDSCSDDEKSINCGDSEQRNGSGFSHINSDYVAEGLEPVQFDLQKSKSDEIFANMSVQSDLNKIKIETEIHASEIQYMRNLMKMYDEQNT